jgi:NADH-quinone oxidoreductase subunit H
MTAAFIVVTIIKIAVAIGFLINGAAIGAWADRRQSAMVQDRVGPNRAVIYVPSNALRAVIFIVAVLCAAPFGYFFWHRAPGAELTRITTGVEVAILVGWFTLMVLSAHVRRHGAENALDRLVADVEPRNYFYTGMVLHIIALIVVRALPESIVRSRGVQWGPGLAGELAAVAIMSAGFYWAAKLPDGHTAVRLAGTLHSVADAIKMIWKEDLRPKNADRLLYELAPLLGIFPALVTIAVIPMGSDVCFKDVDKDGLLGFGDLGAIADVVSRSGQCAAGEIAVSLSVADLNVGLLYVFGIAGTGIIGAAIAGWSSDSKFALLGGLRAASQMVSYEVALGLAIVGMIMVSGSVNLGDIVDWQGHNTWGIFAQPLAFVLFFASVIAETKRVPFDQPEGESEIVAGYFLEYSGMKFGLFMMGEYVEFLFSSVLMVTLFFGGYHLPFLYADGINVHIGSTVLYELKLSHMAVTVIHVLAFFGKAILFAWLHVFVRWTLPRFRYDQLMKLGWTKLLPLALTNILVTGLVLLGLAAAGAAAATAVGVAADLSQALVAVVGLFGAIAVITWLLEPTRKRPVVTSSSAHYADASGGVKPTEMQA